MKLEKYNHILTGFGSNILGNLLMFATTIFLTRTYEAEIYGEFRLLFSFVALIIVFLCIDVNLITIQNIIYIHLDNTFLYNTQK